MAHKHGTYLGGIRDLDDLRLRCVVDDDTGCWHWRLSKCDGVPKVHVTHPALPRPGHIMRGRRAALLLARGRDLPAGHVAYARLCCTSADCVNPDHCQSGDRHAHGRYLTKSGKVKGLLSKRKASRAMWDKRGRKVTPEVAAHILASKATLQALAKELGISQFAVWTVRKKGAVHTPHLAQASVFTWRPDAERKAA
jgi:hypothetical protein